MSDSRNTFRNFLHFTEDSTTVYFKKQVVFMLDFMDERYITVKGEFSFQSAICYQLHGFFGTIDYNCIRQPVSLFPPLFLIPE